MDIFDKVKTKKSSDKLKKKTKKVKVSKKTEETHLAENGATPQVVHDDGWADEAGEAEVEVVVAKLKTNLQMTNLAEEKPEKDGNTDDWNNKDKKEDSEEDSNDKTETPEQTTEAAPAPAVASKEPGENSLNKPAGSGRFVPRHLRGGDASPSLGSGMNSLINQGLRGPGGRFGGRVRDPPKTDDHQQFPTLGAAMKEQSHKAPEGFSQVQSQDVRYRGGESGGSRQGMQTSNKFGAFN